MPRLHLLLILLLIASSAIAQDSLRAVVARDTSSAGGYSQAPDSTSHTMASSDSLGTSVKRYTQSLDSTKHHLTHCIDSLGKLKLPTARFQHQLDSLNKIDPLRAVQQQEAKLTAAEKSVTTKISSAEQKASGPVTSLEKKITQKLTAAEQNGTSSLPSANLPGAGNIPNTTLPAIPGTGNLPNTTLPSISGANGISGAAPPSLSGSGIPAVNNPLASNPLSKETSAVTALPQKELTSLSSAGEAGAVKKDLGQAGQMTQKAEGYGKDISGVLKGDSASRAKLEQRLENEAKNTGGLKSLTAENQQLDSYKKLAGSGANPEALEGQGMQQVKKQAVNHFAGKEQQLQSGMQMVSNLKAKYHRIDGLDKIPKKIPNDLHGKPLIERLVPGVTVQALTGGRRPVADINPWIAYRFTKKISAGAGWNQRMEVHHFGLRDNQHYFGPRTFVNYAVKGGLSFRAEFEMMNTFIPPNQQAIYGDRPRQWIWNSFIGLKKDYKLFKYLKGNAFILYNVNTAFQKHHVNLYGDPISARVGFEFPMRKHMFSFKKKKK